MKVDLISDLHLECKELALPGGDLLILAGDAMEAENYSKAFHKTRLNTEIPADKFLRFFEYECAKYEKVLYVLGNHEHYMGVFENTAKTLRRCLPDNVEVLDRSTYDAGNMLFVGATLWTDCNNKDWHTHYHLARCMNDFHVIKKADGKRFSTHDSVDAHAEDLGYIKAVVKNNAQRDIAVITHHTPSWSSCAPQYKNDRWMNGGFHTELSEFILDHPNIKYWFHGHTHTPFDYMIGDCRVVCNPRGYYPWESSNDYTPKNVMTL